MTRFCVVRGVGPLFAYDVDDENQRPLIPTNVTDSVGGGYAAVQRKKFIEQYPDWVNMCVTQANQAKSTPDWGRDDAGQNRERMLARITPQTWVRSTFGGDVLTEKELKQLLDGGPAGLKAALEELL